MKKIFPVLYKYTSTGAVQQWQIIAEGNKFCTIEGIMGGKLTPSLPTICTPKNVGKKNETTAEAQAILEASAKYQKKLDKGYNQLLTREKKFFEPMLAREYRNSKTKKILVDWENKSIKKFAQPKLDGLRAINEKMSLMSRWGKAFVTCAHLCQDDTVLDGELYNHDFHDDFNAIVSMIKQSKPTEEDIQIAKEFAQYWIYDFPSHKGVFSERYEALKEWYTKNALPGMMLVPTREIFCEQDLKDAHDEFIGLGYEGTIIRLDIAPYENKRSKQLLKYKDFIDEEFEIIGYEEGEGGRTGTIGKFWLWNDKSKPYDIKNKTNCFKSNVKGKFDYLREVWRDREQYMGKTATVKYFNRTPAQEGDRGNVPRFGYVIKIDRESYE